MITHFPKEAKRFIDVGSGSGFPAIPIAIATGLPVDLIEADSRKAAFLQTALGASQVSGTVWAQRAEDCQVSPASCLTARAVGPLSQLLGYAESLLTPGGTCLFLKGSRLEAELIEADRVWQMQVEIIALSASATRILKISHLQARHAARP